MKATDPTPCLVCGCALTEFSEIAASGGVRHHYDCASCGWSSYGHPERITVASAPWTREVWAHAARLERILAVERGDQSAAPEGWVRHRDRGREAWRKIGAPRRVEVWPRAVVSENGDKWGWDIWHAHGRTRDLAGAESTALEAMEAADKATPHEEP